MPYLGNLLRSDGGIELAPEICLKIVEVVIELDPKDVLCLLLTSKSFHSLITTYEKSIIKSFYNINRFAVVNSTSTTVLCSRIPGGAVIPPLTFSWYSETRFRLSTIDFLINHELTEMENPVDRWPILDLPKPELSRRHSEFKRRALLLLYRTADIAAGLKDIKEVRARQSQFLEGLEPSQLATLGIIVEVIGTGWYNMTKKCVAALGLLGDTAGQRRHSSPKQPCSDLLLAITSSIPVRDLSSDNWIREYMCVFEDLVQRYGPYFAWVYVKDSEEKLRRPHHWTCDELIIGMKRMNAFELGYTMSFASLQSVVWRILCRKKEIPFYDCWDAGVAIVEAEMAEY